MNSSMHPRQLLVILSGILALDADASCWAADSTGAAMALGDVFGSERFCRLRCDQDTIKAFIDKHIQPEDMEFSSKLATATRAQERDNQKISTSLKTAQCGQSARVARLYGFVK